MYLLIGLCSSISKLEELGLIHWQSKVRGLRSAQMSEGQGGSLFCLFVFENGNKEMKRADKPEEMIRSKNGQNC